MSNFVTLLVEDDASQREAFADLLKDEGFEVIECATAEAAELIIASTGTELQALITDQQPSRCNVRGAACSICPPPAPAYEHHHYVRQDRAAYIRSTPRSYKSPSPPRSCSKQSAIEKRAGLAPKIASIPHAFSHTANSLRTAAAEFPTLSTAFCNSSFETFRCLVQ